MKLLRTNKPRLDVGRLLEHMGPDIVAEEAASVLYVSEKTLKKWQRHPKIKLDPYEADKYACLIGKHPFQIWSWDWVTTA